MNSIPTILKGSLKHACFLGNDPAFRNSYHTSAQNMRFQHIRLKNLRFKADRGKLLHMKLLRLEMFILKDYYADFFPNILR